MLETISLGGSGQSGLVYGGLNFWKAFFFLPMGPLAMGLKRSGGANIVYGDKKCAHSSAAGNRLARRANRKPRCSHNESVDDAKIMSDQFLH